LSVNMTVVGATFGFTMAIPVSIAAFGSERMKMDVEVTRGLGNTLDRKRIPLIS